jgi:hypothetical protein
MQRSKPEFKAAGFYLAIALILYALVGALSNDIYLPGRRTSGIHLHYEAVPPALLGIILFALTFPLDHFRKSAWLDRTRRALQIGAVFSMSFSFYFVINPSGKKVATTEECQATFSKLAAFTTELSGDGHLEKLLQERGSRCQGAPILKTYHSCIARAQKPADVNSCHGESEMIFKRRNAT